MPLRPQGHQGLPRLPAGQVGQMRQPRAAATPARRAASTRARRHTTRASSAARAARPSSTRTRSSCSAIRLRRLEWWRSPGLLWRCASRPLAGPAPPNDSNRGWDAACCRLCDAAVTWFRGRCPGLTVPGTVKSGQLARQGPRLARRRACVTAPRQRSRVDCGFPQARSWLLSQRPRPRQAAARAARGRRAAPNPQQAGSRAQSPKSRRTAASTTSAANSAPLALRWMPSGSRTIWRRPSISMASR